MTLAHADESKDALIKFGGLWKKITNLIRLDQQVTSVWKIYKNQIQFRLWLINEEESRTA